MSKAEVMVARKNSLRRFEKESLEWNQTEKEIHPYLDDTRD